MNIVQSGLSSSIRALEDELGAELFVRSTRRVNLTVAGRVLLQEARRVLGAAHKAKEAVSAVQGLKRGRLSIGMAQSLSPFLELPALLSQFHADYPAVEIRLCQGASSTLCSKVREGRLDLAFVPLYGLAAEGVSTRMFVCEPLVAACAPAHPLAGQKDVRLADIADQTFIDFQPEWGTRPLVDHAFADAKTDRHVAFEVNDMPTLLDLVAFGLGIALLPERCVLNAGPLSKHAGLVSYAELAPPEICWEMAIVYAGHDEPVSAAAGAFLALIPLDGSL